MSNKLRRFQNLLALSAVTLIIIVWSTVTYLALHNRKLQSTIPQITNYEECVSAGNIILESYPAVCVIKDGGRFVQQISMFSENNFENWKIYTSSTEEFSFMYPPEWSIQTGGGSNYVLLSSEPYKRTNPFVSVNVQNNPLNQNINDWSKNNLAAPIVALKPSETIIDGYDALRYEDETGDRVVVIAKDNFVLSIVYSSNGSIDNYSYNIFDQILSTFKFLSDTSNWETYRHQKLGFEFKYPKNLGKPAESDNANPRRTFYYLYIGFIPEGSDPTSYDLITVTASDEHSTLKDYLDNYWCGRGVNLSSIIPIKKPLIDGNPAQEIECEDESLPSLNIVSEKGEFVYHISAFFGEAHSNYYNKEETKILLNQILSTFKFSDNYPSSYTCPENGWVNCQPILTEEEQKACTQEAFDWYKENCPNYEGVAV